MKMEYKLNTDWETDLELGIQELKKHAKRGKPLSGSFDFCSLTVDEAKAINAELKYGSTHLHKLVREILDKAISYGEYILTKKDMEALADATGYELPEED